MNGWFTNSALMWSPVMKQINGNKILGGPASAQPLLQNGKVSQFLRLNAYCLYLSAMQFFRHGFKFSTDVKFIEDNAQPLYDQAFSYETELYIWKEGLSDLLQPCLDRRSGDNIQVRSRLRLYEWGPVALTAYTHDIFDETSGGLIASRHSFPLKINDYKPKSPKHIKALTGSTFIDQTSTRSRGNLYHFLHAMTVACRLAKEHPKQTVRYVIDFKGAEWRSDIVSAMAAKFGNLSFVQLDDDTTYRIENPIIVSEEIEWLFDFFARKDDYIEVCDAISSYLKGEESGCGPIDPKLEYLRNVVLVRPKEIGRSVLNSAELLTTLKKYDFLPIRPEFFTYREQVCDVFAKAKFVYGIGGAAFTNLAFCTPGATLAAIHQRDAIDPFWNIYVKMFGLNYVCLHDAVRILPDGNYMIDTAKAKTLFETVDRNARHPGEA